ncbi:MAG: hypothetical protein A2Z75_07095 [Chloroflexi bacterium RBG_13_50_10]|nr:MAG: hypothetical protein A2Z75_07095 [Chloroflexi bacterium RBG_13_50_10]
MVTDYRINRTVNYELLSFLKGIDCSGLQFRLLCFWGRHPNAKLSLYVIAKALDTARINLRDSITALVEKGILIAQHNGNGLITYALSGDQRTHRYIDELSNLDWGETANLARQLQKQEAV